MVCGSGLLSSVVCGSGVLLLQWCTVACAVAHESTSILTHTMFLPPFFSSSPLPPAPRRDAQRPKAGGAPNRYPRRQRREPFTSHVRVPPVKKATTVTAGAPPERWALLPHAPQVEGVRSMRRGREEREKKKRREEDKRRREEWREKNEERGEKREGRREMGPAAALVCVSVSCVSCLDSEDTVSDLFSPLLRHSHTQVRPQV